MTQPVRSGAARIAVALLLAAAAPGSARALEAPADSAFLRQYIATDHFTLGRPTGIQISGRGDAVMFLRSGPRNRVRDLYVYDPPSRTERVLVAAESLLGGAAERLTPEERAARERKRLTARGVAVYQLSQDGRRVLVPLSGRLFLVDRASGHWRELAVPGAADEARLSPDGQRVAWVTDGDLFCMEVDSGRRTTLATHHDSVTYGLAEFIAQEEMDRPEGYWWSPDSRWIAYQSTDTRGMEEFHIADPLHPEHPADSSPYPRAGGKNAEVRLAITQIGSGKVAWAVWDAKRYPYLARVVWQEGGPLTLLVENRAQTEERLLSVDPTTGATTTLLVERDPAWLVLRDNVPSWLADGTGFLWITERGGAAQLERRDPRGRLLATLTAPELGLRALVHADPRRGVAWVIAGADPTERHLYRVPLDPKAGAPRRVTEEPGVYGAIFAEGGDLYLLDVRTLAGARRQEIWSTDGERIATLRSGAEEPDFLPELERTRVGRAPELAAAMVRPRALTPGRRYPVIVHVYGGPTSQMVTADRRQYLIDQWMADQGYVVVMVDGRGTPGRGRAWERSIRGDFMSLPLADQIAGLRGLAARHPEIDTTRVGIWGWSFGGYFAAMAVMRRPDVFRAAVAVAPVVDWRDYDTHYTERYLGTPQRQAAAYDKSSVLTYAARLDRPLLIAHGTADDNVYLFHTLKLCDALNRAGRDYELLTLPGQTHMVADPLASLRLYTRLMQHFDRALHPER